MSLNCQTTFDFLKAILVLALILIRLDFTKMFILDVDQSIHGVRIILFQKEGKNERIIAYANKGFSLVQKKFHPMEGECYAPI